MSGVAAQRPAVVVGAGLVGLATAWALQRAEPGRPVLVLEKEPTVAVHQSGHNSGVIHSGLYYRPGSLKARLAVRGGRELATYCRQRGIPFDICGKLVVATRPRELARLAALAERGARNGVPVHRADPVEVARREPHVRALGALWVASTGRIDFGRVADALASDIRAGGGEIRCGVAVLAVRQGYDAARVDTDAGAIAAARVVVCAGLHADRIALASGLEPGVRIVPFRGEFARVAPSLAGLVNGLVYPVPDPALPFLGVHLTRGIDGVLHLGPNAVPALAREGYRWSDAAWRDIAAVLSWPGSWRLGRRYGRIGVGEVARSLSVRSLARAARRMLPELPDAAVRRAPAGVRAQAVARDGSLVDDFVFRRDGAVLHVLNAPSPAATASLAIGRHIVAQLLAD